MAKVVGPLAQKDGELERQALRFRSEQNKPGLRRSQAKHRPDDPSEWGHGNRCKIFIVVLHTVQLLA
jgi:hypothetical protein